MTSAVPGGRRASCDRRAWPARRSRSTRGRQLARWWSFDACGGPVSRVAIRQCTHRAASRASATTSCLPFAIGCHRSDCGRTDQGRPEAGTGNLLKSTRTIAQVVRTRLALMISAIKRRRRRVPARGAASGAVYPKRVVPSGVQHRIAHGSQRATVVEVGAAVREYRDGDREIFQSYPEHDVSWAYHGSVLLPWPNRLRDGSYEFDGEHQQVALTEPSNHNAIHGLAAWLPWTLVEHAPTCVTLSCRLLPSPGYPFQLDTVVRLRTARRGTRRHNDLDQRRRQRVSVCARLPPLRVGGAWRDHRRLHAPHGRVAQAARSTTG